MPCKNTFLTQVMLFYEKKQSNIFPKMDHIFASLYSRGLLKEEKDN
jgi:hypothetical protein